MPPSYIYPVIRSMKSLKVIAQILKDIWQIKRKYKEILTKKISTKEKHFGEAVLFVN